MTLYEDGNPEHQFQSHLGDSSLTCCRKQEQFLLYSTLPETLYCEPTQGCLGEAGGVCDCLYYRTMSEFTEELWVQFLHVRALTVMIEEIAVYDVNQAVQLLFYQATHRDFKDELCKQLAMETQRGQYKLKNKTKNSPTD